MHEQMTHGLQSIGMANKNMWVLPIDSKHSEGSLSPISTDSSYIRVPRFGNLATTTDKTDCFTPCVCAQGNNIMFGALGSTWRHKFYMGTQNDINLER